MKRKLILTAQQALACQQKWGIKLEFRFMTGHMPMPPGMWLPAALMELHISSTAKIMYCRMLDAALAGGVQDENGILFVHYPIAELADDIARCSMTVKRSMNELENAGLVIRVRQGVGTPNRLYVLIPEKEKQCGKIFILKTGQA